MLGDRDPPSATFFETLSLDQTCFSIRLLRIEIREDYEVDWSVQVHDFGSSPPFVALSYEWGGDSAHRVIRLNDAEIHIRENLYQALTALTAEMKSSESEIASGVLLIHSNSLNESGC